MSDPQGEVEIRGKDGGFHAWLIVAASTFIFFLSGTICFIQGLLFREFLKEFEASEFALSWLPGIYFGLMQFSAIVACWVTDVIEYRTMTLFGSAVVALALICSSFVTNLKLFYFTYSVLLGIGGGFQYVPAIFVPLMRIKKRRAMAISITMCGSPLGAFISCPVFQLLINAFGWRGAMLITGAFVLHGCAFGLILVPPKYNLEPTKSYPDVRKQNDMGSIMIYSMERMNNSQFISADMKVHESILTKLKTLFDVSVLKSLSIMCFHWMLFTMGYTTIYTFLPVVSAIRGISKETVSSMLSVVGISDFIGRLCFGFTVNSKKIKAITLLVIVCMLSGAGYISLTWIQPIPAIFAGIFVLAASSGGWLTGSSMKLVDLYGIDKVAKCYGFMQIGHSIAFFISAPLHTSFAEAMGMPSMSFFLTGLLHCFAGFILLLYYKCVYQKKSIDSSQRRKT